MRKISLWAPAALLLLLLAPSVAAAADPVQVIERGYHTEYVLPQPKRNPWAVTVDGQGRIWITSEANRSLGQLDPAAGTWTEHPLPEGMQPFLMAAGPDGRVWITDYDWSAQPGQGHLIAFDPAAGQFEPLPLPKHNTGPSDLVFGPGGELWVSQYNDTEILRRAPDGQQDLFHIDDRRPDGLQPGLFGLALDGSGRVWVAETYAERMARLDPATGKVSRFRLPPQFWGPTDVAVDGAGRLWVGSHGGNRLAALDAGSGKVVQQVYTFSPPEEEGPVSRPTGLTTGANGEVWFAEHEGGRIARIIPAAGTLAEYKLPRPLSWAQWVAPDADGGIWYAAFGANLVGRIAPDAPYTEVQADASKLTVGPGATHRGRLTLTARGEAREVTLRGEGPPGVKVAFGISTLRLEPNVPQTVEYIVAADATATSDEGGLVLGVEADDYLASTTVALRVGGGLSELLDQPWAIPAIGLGIGIAAGLAGAALIMRRRK